jgi:hypothetical protein
MFFYTLKLCTMTQELGDIRISRVAEEHSYHYELYRTELPSDVMVSSFQSTSTPFSPKILRASSAMRSKPPVASARIVGPAPERQMPSRPGCDSGVMEDVTSERPGICAQARVSRGTRAAQVRWLAYEGFTVRLVYAVLHRFIDEFWIWWRLRQGEGKDREALEVEDLQDIQL